MLSQVQDDFICSTDLSSLPLQILRICPSISVRILSDSTLTQVTGSQLLTLVNNNHAVLVYMNKMYIIFSVDQSICRSRLGFLFVVCVCFHLVHQEMVKRKKKVAAIKDVLNVNSVYISALFFSNSTLSQLVSYKLKWAVFTGS